ncbi:hypothetical protein [Bacteroides sp.]|uniref:hypothetical protein n=1 Tax=Bacteroides sp. TaxID=29523 RepID=UPI0026148BCA|nr:hypothetical protein [Bacteroides sp.]MDD3040989.1 hypothetical protein [Bacteroides sp.]
MERPAELNVDARVKTFRYDLLRDLPTGIGDRFGRSINFSEDEAGDIIKIIFDRMYLSKSPEENVVFDVYVRGIFPDWLVGSLTYAFTMCDDIRGFKFLRPCGSSFKVFPK